MTIPFSQQAIFLAVVLVLTGCGGGSSTSSSPVSPTPTPTDPEPTDPEEEEPEEPLPTEPCALSFGHWKQVENQETIGKTNSALNCDGYKSTENVSSSLGKTTTYLWGKDLENPTVMAVYQDDKLSTTTYFPQQTNNTQCFPAKEKIDALGIGQTLKNVQEAIGCTGTYEFSVSDGSDTIYSSYFWEATDQKYNLRLIFDQNNKLYNIEYTEPEEIQAASCTPDYTRWSTVLIGEQYNVAKDKLGCEGIKSSDETTVQWGKSDYSTDRTVAYLNNQNIATKAFIAKDAKTACVPNLAKWQSTITGTTYEQVKQLMQCDGALQSANTSSTNANYIETNYSWKNFLFKDGVFDVPVGGIYHQVSFKGNKMDGKVYFNNVQPFTTCMPTQQGFDKINVGDKWSVVKDAFSCLPKLTYAIEENNQQKQQYSWGYQAEDKVTTYAYVMLDANGQVEEKYVQFNPKQESVILEPVETEYPDPTDPNNPHYPNNPNNPDVSNPGSNNPGICAVTEQQWKDLKQGDNKSQIEGKLGCNGFESLAFVNASAINTEYLWGDNLEKPTILVTLTDGKLSSKNYYPESTTDSTCFPAAEIRNKVLNEMTQGEVEALIGCKGAYQESQSNGSSDIFSIYLWKNEDTQESYTVVFDENAKVISNAYSKTEATAYSTCQPEHQHWENILIQENYIDVKTKVGCEGISTNADNDDTSNTRTWGKSDGSTNRLIVGMWNGYVDYKQFIAKDQISSCTPDYSIWKTLQTGDSYDTVKNTMQCAGILRHLWTTSNANQFTNTGYQWKNIISEDTSSPLGVLSHQISFTGDQLIAKTYTDYKQPFSSCTPTKIGFDGISIGDNWTDIQNTFGCTAKVSYAEEDSTTSPETYTLQYSWGSLIKDKQTTYAYVTLSKRGKVESKYIQFSFQ